MPQTYYDFDPWRRAADNIASGMVAVAQARNRKAMFDAELAQRAPLVQAQTENNMAGARASDALAKGREFDTEKAKYRFEEIKRLAPIIEKGVVRKGNATEFTDEALQANMRLAVLMAEDPEGVTQALENFAKGANYVQLEQQKIDKPVELNEGTRLVDPRTGDPIASGNVKLNMGQQLFTPDETSVSFDPQPEAEGAPGRQTSRAESIRLQALKEDYVDTLRELRKLGAVDSTDEVQATQYNRLQKHRNELERKLGLNENSSLTTPTTPAQGGNTPADDPLGLWN